MNTRDGNRSGVSRVTIQQVSVVLRCTCRQAQRRASTESWPYTAEPVRGGQRRLYPIPQLPPDVRDAVLAHLLQTSSSGEAHLPAEPETLPAAVTGGGLLSSAPPPAPASLKHWQRERASARQVFVCEAHRMAASIGTEAAVRSLLRLAGAGELPQHLQRLLPVANARAGRSGQRTLSRSSLYRWMRLRDAGGFAALAPRDTTRELAIPAWAPALIKIYQQPQKPSLSWAVEQLCAGLPAGATPPSYSAARRFLQRVGTVSRAAGRMLPRELQNLRPFVRRDSSHMWPGDCYTADGHTWDAEVAHPRHGRPFRPEITTVLDVATRRVVGWSAGLAESTWAVLDAQRHAIETGGIPALWYVDNGSGYKNALQADEVVGFAARLGITITHSLPYNSQARGVEERSHKTILVRAAKQLPTYMGADMDREARNNVYKLTRRDIRTAGRSPLLMEWARFLAHCQAEIDGYNARPHRSLPKIRDAATGKLRHESPNEAWERALAEGWAPAMLADAERVDLFRPHQVAKVLRGEVRLHNNLYFSGDLEEHHGEQVQVGYDIHDASRAWVKDMAGRLICVAECDGNRRAYFPQSVIDQAAEKRAKAREKRLETHLQEVRDELDPPALIEHQAGIMVPVSAFVASSLVEAGGVENIHVLPTAEPRPHFTNDPDQYRWLMRNPAQWTPDDADWLLDYAASEDYADLANRYAFQGVAWGDADVARAKNKLECFEEAAGV